MLVQKIIKKYSERFYIKIEHCSVQHDHIHLLIRTGRRSQFQYFFRVVAGQIAQQFEKEGLLTVTGSPNSTQLRGNKGLSALQKIVRLWKHRPFSRVVRGRKNYDTTRDYIQLNEKEVTGKIKYNKKRLRGLSSADWEALWN